MKGFIATEDRRQITPLPDGLDDDITADNPVRLAEACVDALDLSALGFAGRPRLTASGSGRPAIHGHGHAVASLLARSKIPVRSLSRS